MVELCNDASRRVFLAAFMVLGLSLFSITTEADLVADYRFDGTLSSSVPGAPDLVHLGTGSYVESDVNGVPSTVFQFEYDTGFSLDTSGVIPNSEYTIVLLFEFDTVGTWHKVLDFTERVRDSGFYVVNHDVYFNLLHHYAGDPAIVADHYVQLVLTRVASGTVKIYLDGVEKTSFQDSYGDDSELAVAANPLYLFIDDFWDGGAESSGGSVARIRFYDTVLDPVQVAFLDRLVPVTTGTVDFDAETLGDLNQVTVNLSDSTSLILQKTGLVYFSGSGYTWMGTVLGEADSIAVLTADNGEIIGTIHTNLRDWEVVVKQGIPDPVRQFQALSFPIDEDFATSTLPGPASNPNPVNGAIEVDIDSDLGWTAGSDATSHDVYFGSNPTPGFQGNQASTAFNPGSLAYSTTYYWRIDEVNDDGTTTGVSWSFTTEAAPVLSLIFKDGFESSPSPGNQAFLAKGQLEPTIIGCTDEASRVDILVAYTSNAGKKYPDIVNNIQQAINLSNSSFADSLISPDGQPLELNLAGVMEVDWADWAGINWDSMLETLSTDSSVDQERVSASADIVILLTTNIAFTDNGNYASGQALLNGPLQKENAYAALRVDRTKYYALAHEIGHLFGAAHDRYSITYPDTEQGAALPGSHYGFVHIDDENSFNTIMASALECENQLPAVRCIRKNMFSNPDRLIDGITPAGTSNDNNAEQITSTAPLVACYYNSSSATSDN